MRPESMMLGGDTKDPIHFEFDVTDDDAVNASRAYAGYSSRAGFWFGLAAAIAGVLLWALTRDLFSLLFVLVGAIAVAFGRVRALDRRYMRGQPAARIGTHAEMALDEQGLRFWHGGVEGIVLWSAVSELREGEEALLLLQGRSALAYIPKRVFRTEADLAAVRAWITGRIAPRAAGEAPQFDR